MKDTQPRLFDTSPDMRPMFPAASHTHDPETSREAAERHTLSGARAANAALVLRLVKAFPGSTAVELWDGADVSAKGVLKEMQEVRRRLVDLEDAGQVRKGEIRACRIRASNMVTWLAVGEPPGGQDFDVRR